MIARWRWLLNRMTKRLWFRAGLFSLLGVATALLAMVVKDYIPVSLPGRVGADAVDKILGIIASSMLAVTTFSLSTMVTAYGAASSGVTPRATTLVMEDTTTQNALATFIGSFLFSLVGIIILSTGAYGAQGRLVLFAVTIAVVIVIVYTLLRWIDHLSKLGRVGETIDRVEVATTNAIRSRTELPCLGGHLYPADLQVPAHALVINSQQTGYVQHIDVRALEDIAKSYTLHIYLEVLPGSFVHAGMPIAKLVAADDSEAGNIEVQKILTCVTTGIRRTFEHDPRFGLSVLSEIASRALSPAVNDPGTAIDVIGRGVRVLGCWGTLNVVSTDAGPECGRVWLRGLAVDDMFDDFFAPIARDGASLLEIDLRLVKALASLVQMNPELFRDVCAKHMGLVLKRAETSLSLEDDILRLRDAVAKAMTQIA